MSPFEIYIIHVSWGSSGKVRPVMAFVVDENTVGIYQITTQYANKSEEIKAMYFKINDWAQAGLVKPSFIDTVTLITLSKDSFANKIPVGTLSNADKQRLFEFLTI